MQAVIVVAIAGEVPMSDGACIVVADAGGVVCPVLVSMFSARSSTTSSVVGSVFTDMPGTMVVPLLLLIDCASSMDC